MITNKQGVTKNSTGTFKVMPNGDAFSYDWYMLGKFIGNGRYLINDYNYSNTTLKHRHNLLKLLDYGKNIELIYVEAPKGLNNVTIAIEYNLTKLKETKEKLIKPRSRQTTKEKLIKQIEKIENDIKLLKTLKGT